MVFYQFQQAGNEENQSLKKLNSEVGIVATGSNGIVARKSAKIRYAGHFAIIANFRYTAKITMHSENFNFRFACIFRYDSEF